MRTAGEPDEIVVPVIEERLVTGMREVETGRVRVRTVVDEATTTVREALVHGHIEIDRVAIGEEVTSVPAVRDEGDTIVVPVVREEIVVTKRLILVEEVRLRRIATTETFVQPVTLRSQRAVVERLPPETSFNSTKEN